MIWNLLRKRENTATGPALLGKLPCQPDFVRAGFRGPASDALDAFLVQASPILHQGVGVAQLPNLLVCQSLPRQTHGLFGVCAPSRDAAGRPFPVAIVHALPQTQLRAAQSEVFWRYGEFVRDARAMLGRLDKLTLADARSELDALPPIDPDAAADGSRELPPMAGFDRALTREESKEPDAQSYALYAVASAFAARHPGLTLDCPAQDASQARLWLTLTARVAEVTASTLCILYAPEPGRMLIAIDAWHPGQLRAIADPGFSFDQLWPLVTTQADARAHARGALEPGGAALARPCGASLRDLADQLGQFALGLRG